MHLSPLKYLYRSCFIPFKMPIFIMTSMDMRIALISRESHVHCKICPFLSVLSLPSSTLMFLFCYYLKQCHCISRTHLFWPSASFPLSLTSPICLHKQVYIDHQQILKLLDTYAVPRYPSWDVFLVFIDSSLCSSNVFPLSLDMILQKCHTHSRINRGQNKLSNCHY